MGIFQFSDYPVVKGTVILKFQSTDGMSNALNSVLNRMGEIIHGINTPFVPCIVMGHMGHPVDNRIPHIHIRRRHVDFCAEHLLSILVFSFSHLFKETEIFFHAAVSIRAFFSRLR